MALLAGPVLKSDIREAGISERPKLSSVIGFDRIVLLALTYSRPSRWLNSISDVVSCLLYDLPMLLLAVFACCFGHLRGRNESYLELSYLGPIEA